LARRQAAQQHNAEVITELRRAAENDDVAQGVRPETAARRAGRMPDEPVELRCECGDRKCADTIETIQVNGFDYNKTRADDRSVLCARGALAPRS
jgi:hypothetical protein